jgi:hypothetical protein
MVHTVKFERNTETNEYRAICTCGWIRWSKSLEELQRRAPTHDMEWQAVDDKRGVSEGAC